MAEGQERRHKGKRKVARETSECVGLVENQDTFAAWCQRASSKNWFAVDEEESVCWRRANMNSGKQVIR